MVLKPVMISIKAKILFMLPFFMRTGGKLIKFKSLKIDLKNIN